MKNIELIRAEQPEMNKANIKVLADALSYPVIDGEISPVEAYAKLRYMEEVIKVAKTAIEGEITTELAKDKQGIGYGSVLLQLRNGGAMYDYSDNPEWVEAQAKVKEIEEKMKAAAKAPGTVVDEDTGEIIPKAKISYKKDSIATTIK